MRYNNIHLLHAGEGNMKTYSPKSIIFPGPRGIWYSWVDKFSYILYQHAINVLLCRMKPRKHIYVKYCWQTYFKSIGKNQNTWSHRTKNHIPWNKNHIPPLRKPRGFSRQSYRSLTGKHQRYSECIICRQPLQCGF
jgi:hypothetical protein